MSDATLPSLSALPLDLARAVDAACRRFEEACQGWQQGRPRLEDFLSTDDPQGRSVLLAELLRLEIAYRQRLGEPPGADEFRRRFPDVPWLGDLLRDAGVADDDDPDATRPGPGPGPDTTDAGIPPGYELLGELGRGGMGVVYRVRHVKLNRVCALKMVLAGAHASPGQRERFLTEAQATARLAHPGIVQVFEVGEHQGHAFMTLELCPGGSLDQRLRDRPPTAKEAATTVRALALAVQVAHDAQVLHRDLKPANVLIAGDGTLKISDFGMAKKLDEVDQTRTGAVVGTPAYMAPEQARGDRGLGPGVDVYGLGAILYAALTGRPPFRGATVPETLRQVEEAEAVPVRQLNPSVPRDLETIVHKCLEKEASRRYASAAELAGRLQQFLDGKPIPDRPVGSLERAARWVRRNPVVSSLMAMVVLVLTAGVGASWVLTGWALNEATTARQAETEVRQQKARAEDQLRRAEWLVYAGKLLLAEAALNENNLPDAFRHLDECQWDLRGWEHAHLRWRFDASKQTLQGHAGGVTSLAWSPDGKRILTGSWDSTAKVWDADMGTELLSLKGHGNGVSSVAFSPDGKRILTGSEDKTAKLWDAEKGTQVLTLMGHTGEVRSVSFSPDGKRILTGSGAFDKPGEAKLWDADTGIELLSLKGHTDSVSSVAWSPDGKRIVTGSSDDTAKVWDADRGTEYLSLKGHPNGLTSVAWSPDGKRILTGSENVRRPGFEPGEAKVWDAVKGTELLALKLYTDVTSVAWSPDGKRILTGCRDQTAKVWDGDRGTELLSLMGHTDSVSSAAWSPDGKRILTGSWDQTAKVWDADMGTELLSLKGHGNGVSSVAFSPDGKRILTGSGVFDKPGEAKLWDAEKGTEVLTLKGHADRVTSVAWSPDGKRILTGSGQNRGPGEAKLWDAEKGTEVLTLKGHTDRVSSVACSPDCKRILTGSWDSTAKVWDAEKGKEVLALKGHTQAVTSVAWSPDGKRILTGSDDQTAKVWDGDRGTELLSLMGHTDSVSSVAWSPDGKRILTGSGKFSPPVFVPGEAKVWDTDKGIELLSLKGHSIGVTSMAWSPDGRRMLTGILDSTAKLRDAKKGTVLLTFKGHTGSVESVSFSSDGKKAFAWDVAGKVLAWNTATGQPVAADNPPPRPAPGSATSPDGRLAAKPDGPRVQLVDLLRPAPEGSPWPLPDAAQRKRYHTDQAARAEKEKQWFAVAFHVGRLLLDDPDNAALKKRREDALREHAAPKRMP